MSYHLSEVYKTLLENKEHFAVPFMKSFNRKIQTKSTIQQETNLIAVK